jgi:hypothetical protein
MQHSKAKANSSQTKLGVSLEGAPTLIKLIGSGRFASDGCASEDVLTRSENDVLRSRLAATAVDNNMLSLHQVGSLSGS